ncbi:MAG: hypothetical protein OEZ43_05710 [Gammaproteobacteria bacterium]|nr:hypothetical protein [Gammaproteobacteria bacterium]
MIERPILVIASAVALSLGANLTIFSNSTPSVKNGTNESILVRSEQQHQMTQRHEISERLSQLEKEFHDISASQKSLEQENAELFKALMSVSLSGEGSGKKSARTERNAQDKRADMSEDAQEYERDTFVSTHIKDFEGEAGRSDWGNNAESVIVSGFVELQAQGADLLGVECRQNLCKIQVQATSESEMDSLISKMDQVVAWPHTGSVELSEDNGKQLLTMIVSK